MTRATITDQDDHSKAATQLLRRAEEIRLAINAEIDPVHRGPLGQFTTPVETASLMAAMFSSRKQKIRLLDPGAGTGSLTAAFVAHQLSRRHRPKSIAVTAFEVDAHMAGGLIKTLKACEDACSECHVSFAYDLRCEDYIRDCAGQDSPLELPGPDKYDAVIMNPPYHKINSQSDERQLLRSIGIEVSNLYSAFMLLAARQIAEGGEFISITPRSFCNGPYFKRFRLEFLSLLSVSRIHVFESRSKTFRADDVLQENVIVYGVGRKPQACMVTISTTSVGGHLEKRDVSFHQVVRPDDPERVIHIISDDRGEEISERMQTLRSSLDSLGLTTSTGRVVDFRAREHLRDEPTENTAPLIFPAHMKDGRIIWPNGNTRKPNAILDNDRTASLLIDAGYYVLVKRFSAKEERRRVVAALYDPIALIAERVGFDNKTNYYHISGHGLPEMEAKGLTVFLNSSLVDEYFRLFSGHTQVNAADLRRLPYPTREQLVILAQSCDSLADQHEVDEAINSIL